MSRFDGIATRIALAALLVAVVAMAVLGLGVLVIGGQTFGDLMEALGSDVSRSESMFQDSVGRVVLVSLVVAVALSVTLAMVIGRRLARPVREASEAARRVARGDFATRLPREGPAEMRDLAESIDRMAAALEEQRAMRDRFIRDASHELRTPLTVLRGNAEVGLAMGPSDCEHEPILREIVAESARMTRLVQRSAAPCPLSPRRAGLPRGDRRGR